MTPNELLETLELHAKSSVCQVEPRDCAQWAKVLRSVIWVCEWNQKEFDRLMAVAMRNLGQKLP